MEYIPTLGQNRIEAIELTSRVSGQHGPFRDAARRGDLCRDKSEFAEAETAYSEALRHFPLHGGYRVQYGHMLKEQGKFTQASVQYAFALALGVPPQEVEEHFLFATRKGGHAVTPQYVQQVTRAWSKAKESGDDWDLPPIQEDFLELARLFWGNEGVITESFMQRYLLRCLTKRDLFIALLDTPETLSHNRLFFVMTREKGPVRV